MSTKDEKPKSADQPKNPSDELIDTHRIPVPKLFEKLKSSPIRGLTKSEVSQRLEKYGENIFPKESRLAWYLYLLIDMFSGRQYLFWVGAFGFYVLSILEFIGNGYRLSVGIIIVSLVTGLFAFYQRWDDWRTRAKFEKNFPGTVSVLRDGTWTKIDGKGLVPGDVIEVNMQSIFVPADVRAIQVSNCKISNYYITGANAPQVLTTDVVDHSEKHAPVNLAFYGSIVIDGKFNGLVLRTGKDTLIGQIRNVQDAEISDQKKKEQ